MICSALRVSFARGVVIEGRERVFTPSSMVPVSLTPRRRLRHGRGRAEAPRGTRRCVRSSEDGRTDRSAEAVACGMTSRAPPPRITGSTASCLPQIDEHRPLSSAAPARPSSRAPLTSRRRASRPTEARSRTRRTTDSRSAPPPRTGPRGCGAGHRSSCAARRVLAPASRTTRATSGIPGSVHSRRKNATSVPTPPPATSERERVARGLRHRGRVHDGSAHRAADQVRGREPELIENARSTKRG